MEHHQDCEMMEAASFGTMGNICNCKELYREEVSALESQLAASQVREKELNGLLVESKAGLDIMFNVSLIADIDKALSQPTDTAPPKEG